MNEVLKIYWCEEAGSVFWSQLGDQDVYVAPMNLDNTSDFSEGTIAEYWEENMKPTEAEVRKILGLDPR